MWYVVFKPFVCYEFDLRFGLITFYANVKNTNTLNKSIKKKSYMIVEGREIKLINAKFKFFVYIFVIISG